MDNLKNCLENYLLQAKHVPQSHWSFPVAVNRWDGNTEEKEILLIQKNKVDSCIRVFRDTYPSFAVFYAAQLDGREWSIIAPVACVVHARGAYSHWCPGRLLLAVESFECRPSERLGETHLAFVKGQVITVKECPTCGAFRNTIPGDVVECCGKFLAEYYEHEGLLL